MHHLDFSELGAVHLFCALASALHVHSSAAGIAVGVGMALLFGLGGTLVVRRLKPFVLSTTFVRS
jgi:hypothetical protein